MRTWIMRPMGLLKAVLAMSLVAVLAACVPSANVISTSQNTGQRIDPNGPVRVALLVPGGSPDGNLNNLATNFVQAARLAVGDFESARIDLKVYNTAGDATQAANVAQQAVASGAKIIIGPLFAEAANAVGNAVAAQNVNVLSFSNNTEIAGGNVFILGQTFSDKAARVLSYASSQGYRSVTAVAPNNAEGEIATRAIQEGARRAGVRYDGAATYDFSPQGITEASPRIASQVKNAGSASVLLTANSDGGLSIFGQMLPGVGLGPRDVKYLGMTRWDIPRSNLASPGLVGGWFTLPDVTAVQQFNQRFNAAYSTAPHPLSGLAYDGISAIAKLVGSGNANALTKAGLTRRGGFFGTSGVFRFNSDGTNERAQAIAESTGSSFRVISGAPKSFAGGGS